MAAQIDLEWFKGEAILQPFQHVAPGTTTPQNITGWTITFTVKPTQTNPVALLTSTPLTITNGAQGLYQLQLTHAQNLLKAGSYYYDIQRVDAGSEGVMASGRLNIDQEVLYP